MLKRVAHLIAFTLIAFSAFAQHEHRGMTIDDWRQLVAAGSQHGPVIPQPAYVVTPTATRTITLRASSFQFSPTTITVNQGDIVQLTLSVPSGDASTIGHGLVMETYFDGTTDEPFNVGRGKSVTKTFTATTSGKFLFACNVPSCGSGHSDMLGTFNVTPASNPAPTISSLNPSSGSTTGGQTTTISGTNLASGATASFGGTAATNVNVVSSTSITAVTPAHAVGSVPVTVANLDGQSGTLNGGYQYNLPIPTLTGINPTTGPTSGNTLVTLTGTNFQAGATVTIGGTPATNVTVVSATTLTARTPLGPATQQVSQAVAVKVTNPDSSSATASIFTYSVPAVAIADVIQPVGPPAGGNVVTILGAGFATDVTSSLTFGGVAATNLQVVNAVTLSATVPPHTAGAVDVVVTMGPASAKATNGYVYGNPTSKKRIVKR